MENKDMLFVGGGAIEPLGGISTSIREFRWIECQQETCLDLFCLFKKWSNMCLYMDVSENGGTPKTPQNDHF